MNNDINLVPAIKVIEAQINEMEYEHKKNMAPYIESLENLRRINTACEKCGGSKIIFRRACAEDEGMDIPCPDCKGTGKATLKDMKRP